MQPDPSMLLVFLCLAAAMAVPLLVLVCWLSLIIWREDRRHRRGYWRKWLPDPDPRTVCRNERAPVDYALPRNRVSRVLPPR